MLTSEISGPAQAEALDPDTVSVAVVLPLEPTEGKILSAADGLHAASSEAQRMLVLTEHGLFIAFGSRTKLPVLEYIERLRRNGVRYQEYSVSIESISAAYKRHNLAAPKRVNLGAVAADEQHRIIDMLHEALQEDASDMHFIVSREGCDVRFRILGQLETRHPFTREEGFRLTSSLYNSMCDIGQQSFNPNASQRARLDAKYTEALGLYGARVQTRPTHDGVLMVLRLLKSDNRILTHRELGFLDSQVATMQELAAMPYGVTLISGPTGSGKSRTLQATMAMTLENEHNAVNVITIEDPPEYPIPGAVVTPLVVADRSDLAMVSKAWQDAVSESMRLDPDVIMVGEVSDLGSAKTAFSAAKTGHGVWSTLHANDATSIPKRLVDMNVSADDVLDPTLLVGLTAQRLVPTLCPDCKMLLPHAKDRLRPVTLARLIRVTPRDALARVCVRGDGCATCKGRGIVGRIPVIEVVKTDVEFMEAFITGGAQASLNARKHWVNTCGGITMLRHALHLVWQGLVDPKDAEDVRPLDSDLTMLGKDYAEEGQLV